MSGAPVIFVAAPGYELLAFGVEPKNFTATIEDLPADVIRVRRRIRIGDVMRVFVKTPKGVTEHHVFYTPNGLRLGEPLRGNITES